MGRGLRSRSRCRPLSSSSSLSNLSALTAARKRFLRREGIWRSRLSTSPISTSCSVRPVAGSVGTATSAAAAALAPFDLSMIALGVAGKGGAGRPACGANTAGLARSPPSFSLPPLALLAAAAEEWALSPCSVALLPPLPSPSPLPIPPLVLDTAAGLQDAPSEWPPAPRPPSEGLALPPPASAAAGGTTAGSCKHCCLSSSSVAATADASSGWTPGTCSRVRMASTVPSQ